MLPTLLALAALLAPPPGAARRAATHELRSPDGLTVLSVELADVVRWSVTRRGRAVLRPSRIGLDLEGGPALGRSPVVCRTRRDAVDLRLPVPVPVRRRTVADRHRELQIGLRDGLTLEFRAWDDAVAYRLRTAREGEVRVRGEEAEFRFPEASVGSPDRGLREARRAGLRPLPATRRSTRSSRCGSSDRAGEPSCPCSWPLPPAPRWCSRRATSTTTLACG